MEIDLEKYSNFIIGWKDSHFTISKDSLIYYSYINHNTIHIYHLSDLYYSFFTLDNNKLIIKIPKKNYSDDIKLKPIENMDEIEFRLFLFYLNYTKLSLEVNIDCFNYLQIEKYSLNTKEMYLNMNLYVTEKYYKEIIGNINKKKSEANSYLIIMKKQYFLGEKTSFLDDIYNDLKDLNEKMFDDKKLNEISSNEIVEINTLNKMKIDNSENNKYHLENIDKLRQYYLSLIRLLIEFRRTIFERLITSNYKIYTISNITDNNIKFNKLDIVSRFLFIKEGDLNINDLEKKNEELKNNKIDLLKSNENLLKALKNYIKENNYQLYYCFKCGNIVSKTEIKSSNCNYDKNCQNNISYFYCKLCQIHFCNYCIFFPKNLKCLKGHFYKPKLQNIKNLSCSLCDNQNLNNECYYICDQCNDINICSYCYDKIKKNITYEYKCEICNNSLLWRKGLIKKCNKCNFITKCFWHCFFCKNFYCPNCLQTEKNKCGLNHNLIEINLNHDEEINNNFTERKINNHNHINEIIYNCKMLNRTNCDICHKKFSFKYYICIRCFYIKCQACYNKK